MNGEHQSAENNSHAGNIQLLSRESCRMVRCRTDRLRPSATVLPITKSPCPSQSVPQTRILIHSAPKLLLLARAKAIVENAFSTASLHVPHRLLVGDEKAQRVIDLLQALIPTPV